MDPATHSFILTVVFDSLKIAGEHVIFCTCPIWICGSKFRLSRVVVGFACVSRFWSFSTTRGKRVSVVCSLSLSLLSRCCVFPVVFFPGRFCFLRTRVRRWWQKKKKKKSIAIVVARLSPCTYYYTAVACCFLS